MNAIVKLYDSDKLAAISAFMSRISPEHTIYGGAVRDAICGDIPADFDIAYKYTNIDVLKTFLFTETLKETKKSSSDFGKKYALNLGHQTILLDVHKTESIKNDDFRCNSLVYKNGEISGKPEAFRDCIEKKLVPCHPVCDFEKLATLEYFERDFHVKIYKRAFAMQKKGWKLFPQAEISFITGKCPVLQETSESCISLQCTHIIDIDCYLQILLGRNPRCPLCRKDLQK